MSTTPWAPCRSPQAAHCASPVRRANMLVPREKQDSLAQGVSTREPGGVAAGAVDTLRSTLDIDGPGLAEAAAAILGASAREVAPRVGMGAFASPFAALSYSRKDQVVRTLAQSHDA